MMASIMSRVRQLVVMKDFTALCRVECPPPAARTALMEWGFVGDCVNITTACLDGICRVRVCVRVRVDVRVRIGVWMVYVRVRMGVCVRECACVCVCVCVGVCGWMCVVGGCGCVCDGWGGCM